jgi:hypothetical protein
MYEQFEKKYAAEIQRFGAAAGWEDYRGGLPDEFIDFMGRTGIASFDNGFIWTVDPAFYEPVLLDWNLDPEGDVVVARTGVGDLFLWNGEDVYILDAHRGKLEQVTKSIDYLFDYFLCDQKYLNNVHFRKQFEKAIEKEPGLMPEECLHFVPALALGGPDAAGNLQRVDIGICHSLLSQIHLPKT